MVVGGGWRKGQERCRSVETLSVHLSLSLPLPLSLSRARALCVSLSTLLYTDVKTPMVQSHMLIYMHKHLDYDIGQPYLSHTRGNANLTYRYLEYHIPVSRV